MDHESIVGPSGGVASFDLAYDAASDVITKDQEVAGAPKSENGR